MATRARIVLVVSLLAAGLAVSAAPRAEADPRGGVVCQVTYEFVRAGSITAMSGSGTCVGVDGGVYTATLSTLSVPAREGCPGTIPFTLLVRDTTTGVGAVHSLVWDPYLVPAPQSSLIPGGALPLVPSGLVPLIGTPQVFAGSLLPNGLRMVSVAQQLCLADGDVEWHTGGIAVIELGAITL